MDGFDFEALINATYGGDEETDDSYGDDIDIGSDDFLHPESPLFDYGNMNPYKDAKEEPAQYVRVGSEDIADELPDYITDEEVQKYSSVIYPEEKVLRSLILEFFTPKQILEFEKITRNLEMSNNDKVDIIRQKLDEWNIPYSPLNPGTNRLGLLIDGYAVKIAIDADGKIDNQREFIYSMQLQPYVVKCYEIVPNGVIGIFEYVEVFSIDDFYKNQSKMREILTEIAAKFLIGDVGVSSTNYLNWGYRDGIEPVILDFAYIYSVKFKTFTCSCGMDSILHYDKDFNNLICPRCNKKYAFKDIRKKITRADQKAEIGDVTQKGYVISCSEETVKFNPKFTEGAEKRIFKALIKMKKKADKKLMDKNCRQIVDHDNDMSIDEIVDAINRGELK
jgi:hypothetical protein